MPRERRRGEEDFDDPAERSFVSKVAHNRWVDVAIRLAIVIATASGAGYVSNEHADGDAAVKYENLARVEQEFQAFKTAYYTRQRERGMVATKEREELLQRLVAIETELRLMRRGR